MLLGRLVVMMILLDLLQASDDNNGDGQVQHLSPGLLIQIHLFTPAAIRVSVEWLSTVLKREATYAASRSAASNTRRENSFSIVQTFLGGSPLAKQLSYSAFIQTKYLQLIKLRFQLSKSAIQEVQCLFPSLLSANLSPLYADDVPATIPPPYVCPYARQVVCQETAIYRTFDGCCNNLKNRLWGAAFQPLNRFIFPDYADGIDTPRMSQRGDALPNARLVSFTIHDDVDVPSSAHTLLFMLLGQFLDHDLSRTAISKLSVDETGVGGVEDVKCGADGCESGTLETQTCLPIGIPPGDPVFHGKPCLEFVRTLQVPASDDCHLGPRQQLNQITSYLDASHIYGSSKTEADILRDRTQPDRGRLSMRAHPSGGGKKPILPEWEQFSLCNRPNRTVKCFRAGDGRVNEHLGLMCLHTILAREHNRLEAGLHSVNPHWSGEKLYQETRRILDAIWQFIIYNEYLPLLLGGHVMDAFALTLSKQGHANVYNEGARPDVSNAFATAAFRFGHSQIQQVIKLVNPSYFIYNNSIKFSETFRTPHLIYEHSGPDVVLRGFVTDPAQTIDSHVTKQVTEHLFAERPPGGLGLDLVAINVQRGRDHGLPGYARWREWCGYGRPTTFDDLYAALPYRIVQKLKVLYSEVDDIDLFPAGLSERPIDGSLIGPTFACIIATQMRNSKQGDRFWHENKENNPHPFTEAQLSSIRQMSLAKIMCTNGDSMQVIQPLVLLQPFSEVWRPMWSRGDVAGLRRIYGQYYHGNWNYRVGCSSIPDIDLSHWKEVGS